MSGYWAKLESSHGQGDQKTNHLLAGAAGVAAFGVNAVEPKTGNLLIDCAKDYPSLCATTLHTTKLKSYECQSGRLNGCVWAAAR